NAQPVAGALHLDPADGGPLELAHQVVADVPVLDEIVRVLAVAEPSRLPVGGDAQAEPVGVDLLTHYSSFSCDCSASAATGSLSGRRLTITVRWQVRFRMRVARPRARGRHRFRVGPSSA